MSSTGYIYHGFSKSQVSDLGLRKAMVNISSLVEIPWCQLKCLEIPNLVGWSYGGVSWFWFFVTLDSSDRLFLDLITPCSSWNPKPLSDLSVTDLRSYCWNITTVTVWIHIVLLEIPKSLFVIDQYDGIIYKNVTIHSQIPNLAGSFFLTDFCDLGEKLLDFPIS